MRYSVLLALLALTVSACTTTEDSKRSPNQEDMRVMLRNSDGKLQEAKARPDLVSAKDFTPISPDEIDDAITEQNAERIRGEVIATPTLRAEEMDATVSADAEEVIEAVATAAEHIQHTRTTSFREAGPVDAEKAQRWLRNGNARYTKGHLRNDGASSADRRRLAHTQSPHAVIVSCSDSRVPPEVAFDQKLGEIFVVRNMATSIADNSVASIEYAVGHLGSNLVVLLGHESCGGIEAALAAVNGAQFESPLLQNTLAEIQPHLASFAGQPASEGHLHESWANLEGIANQLLERSAILRDAVASGEVKIVKAMYRMNSGLVEWR